MPGTISIDARNTFATMLVMNFGPKLKFGTSEPDISANGEKKHTVECAVTYLTEPGMRPQSEVISVTVTGPNELHLQAGQPVEFDRLRCGFSAPERGTNDRIRGGKPYFMASGVRQAQRPAEGKAA